MPFVLEWNDDNWKDLLIRSVPDLPVISISRAGKQASGGECRRRPHRFSVWALSERNRFAGRLVRAQSPWRCSSGRKQGKERKGKQKRCKPPALLPEGCRWNPQKDRRSRSAGRRNIGFAGSSSGRGCLPPRYSLLHRPACPPRRREPSGICRSMRF